MSGPEDICLRSCFRLNPQKMISTPAWLIVNVHKVSFYYNHEWHIAVMLSYFLEIKQDIDVAIKYLNT